MKILGNKTLIIGLAALFGTFCGWAFSADTITITPTAGQNVCVITITLDVTTERATAIADKAAGLALAANKAKYALSLIPRLYAVIENNKIAGTLNDAAIDAANVAAKAADDVRAAAQKAARPTVGDPTQ